MDKDRIAGAAKEIKGTVKQVVGKSVGDTRLESQGKVDKATGKLQKTVGGLKDAVRDKLGR